ncbi:hypothetical protein ACQPWW_22890 [Micromonospora sp. CA-240977]|uniref:hypothetical protein n=1 Tax=Micromonospora sp. CA-240977 TaxID=3239957 RepID=UPI003D93E43D
MTRPPMRKWLPMAATVPLVLTLAVGCGKTQDKNVASAGGSSQPNAAASTTPSLSARDRQFKYAQCMREHGVPMSDPIFSGDDVTFTVPSPRPDQATQDRAQAACGQYQGSGNGGARPREKTDALRQYSQCMRQHDVEHFPDPGANGDVQLHKSVGDDPQFPAAKAACDAMMASNHPNPGSTR